MNDILTLDDLHEAAINATIKAKETPNPLEAIDHLISAHAYTLLLNLPEGQKAIKEQRISHLVPDPRLYLERE